MKKLFYVGYSQGTTSFFLMVAAKPEYNEKVIMMTALAPVVYLSNVQHLLVSFIKHHLKAIQEMADRNGVYEIIPHTSLMATYADIFCHDNTTTQLICSSILYLIGGYSPNLNKTVLPVIYGELPAGISTKILFHYAQLALAEKFQMYDYGLTANINRYGHAIPPKFNISKITTPISLYYGGCDSLSTRPDIELLLPELPNFLEKKFIKGYAHFDFVWGKNAASQVYDNVIRTMKKFSK